MFLFLVTSKFVSLANGVGWMLGLWVFESLLSPDGLLFVGARVTAQPSPKTLFRQHGVGDFYATFYSFCF